jgi:hypothetical protein
VRVLADVAEAREHAVAPVLGVGDALGVEDLQEAGRPGAKAGVALATGVRGADEGHLHPADERDHLGVQVVEHLVAVEAFGPLSGAVGLLQQVLARAARQTRGSTNRVKFHRGRVYRWYQARDNGFSWRFGWRFGELEVQQSRIGNAGGCHLIRTHGGHSFITAR